MSQAALSGWAECAIELPGGTLVIAPAYAFGSAAAGVVLSTAAIRLLQGHPAAFGRLRADWRGLGLPGDPGRLSNTQMFDLLSSAVAGRRLVAAFYAVSPDPVGRLGIPLLPTAAVPHPALATTSVRDMSRTERIEAALKRVPAYLTGALKDQFLALISPTSIAITVAAFAALAVGQFFGYGEVVDAALAALAYYFAGLAGIRALYEMVAATVAAARATNDAEIDAAAKRLASAFVVLGMAFLSAFITRAAQKAKQAVAAKSAEPPPVAEDTGSTSRTPRTRPARSSVPGAAPVGDVSLYRADGRPPGTIFDEGFQPRGTSTDLKTYVDTNAPSGFVSTSTTPAIADNPAFGQPGKYLYQIDGSRLSGVDVNQAYPDNPFANESEIAVVNGIPSSSIVSARPILPGGGLGEPIMNPNYVPGP